MTPVLALFLVAACEDRQTLAGDGLLEGIPTPEVAYTYGQVWTKDTLRLHDGLDLIAPEGTLVRALEAGTLRQVPEGVFGNPRALVIESSAMPSEGWLYEHVIPLTPPPAGGRTVESGAPIGRVAPALLDGYAHLHLERVSTAGATCDGNADPYPAVRNPLEYPEVRALVADLEPPLFLPLESPACASDGEAANWIMLQDPQGDPVCSSQAIGQALLVVCRVSDRSQANGMELAPFNVSLSIDGPGSAEVHFPGPEFEGPIFERCYSGDVAQVVYALGPATSISGFAQRELYLVVNSRLVDHGDRVAGERTPWSPTVPGDYVLEFRVLDRSGNEAVMKHTLTLGP